MILSEKSATFRDHALRRCLPRDAAARPLRGIYAREAAEVIQDGGDLLGRELNLRHVSMSGAHSLREPALQLLDGVAEINIPKRRRLLQRARAGCLDGMTTATVLLENGFSVAGGAR